MALDVSPVGKFLNRTSQDTVILGLSLPGSKMVAMVVRSSFAALIWSTTTD